jgi:cytochrome c
MKYPVLAAFLMSMGFGLIANAHAAGDATHGSKVFEEECSDCHSTTAGKNKKGPSLAGISGRKAASIADFNYSDAMKASGIVWTADKIDPYITHPKKVVPGGKMKYEGLDDEKARADVISFLMTLH